MRKEQYEQDTERLIEQVRGSTMNSSQITSVQQTIDKIKRKQQKKLNLLSRRSSDIKAYSSQRGEKGPLQMHNINKWLKGQSKAKEKAVSTIKDQYIKTVAQIDGEKQIKNMFERLDEDGSNSLDMQEICNLFTENGIQMTIDQCTEMFNVVYDIKNAYLQAEQKKTHQGPNKDPNKKKEINSNLILSLEDFHIITSRSRQALLELQQSLTEIRRRMRENDNSKYVPVTVDELMYQFCTAERRKEIKQIRDNHNGELMRESLHNISEQDIEGHVTEVMQAWNHMVRDSSEEFSRFKNEQNQTYLNLLEQATVGNRRNLLLNGTQQY